jgi:hypothetical protein
MTEANSSVSPKSIGTKEPIFNCEGRFTGPKRLHLSVVLRADTFPLRRESLSPATRKLRQSHTLRVRPAILEIP